MSRRWSERSLRNLKGIHPDLRRVFDAALQETPLDFIVIEGLRTEARQRELVASGASETMRSRHLTGHAVDILPIGHDGKPAFAWPLYHQVAPVIKAVAERMGVDLEWGGDWQSFKDGPHFQLSWERYPAGQAFTPVPVTAPARAVAAAKDDPKALVATATTVTGAAGTTVAAVSNAPDVVQYAIAFAIALAALALFWRMVRS